MIEDGSEQMKSAEKRQPSKKVLLDTIKLIESFTIFENGNLAKQLKKHILQLNEMVMWSSCTKKSMIHVS